MSKRSRSRRGPSTCSQKSPRATPPGSSRCKAMSSTNVFDLSVERLERHVEALEPGEQKVAALALIYGELVDRGIFDRIDFDETLEIDDIVMSILTRAGARWLSEVDWLIVQVLDEPQEGRGRLS